MRTNLVMSDLENNDMIQGTAALKGAHRVLDESTTEMAVTCYPLINILRATGLTQLDVLFLDVQGIEADILQTVPWEEVDIKVIVLEFDVPRFMERDKKLVMDLLEPLGYRLVTQILADPKDPYEYLWIPVTVLLWILTSKAAVLPWSLFWDDIPGCVLDVVPGQCPKTTSHDVSRTLWQTVSQDIVTAPAVEPVPEHVMDTRPAKQAVAQAGLHPADATPHLSLALVCNLTRQMSFGSYLENFVLTIEIRENLLQDNRNGKKGSYRIRDNVTDRSQGGQPKKIIELLGHRTNLVMSDLENNDMIQGTAALKGAHRVLDESTTEMAVTCYPLINILRATGLTQLDILFLDVQGIEADILQTVPWEEVDIKH
ncbi:unnamed protein product [Notodromas monacha]|uniref:Methyltransferase FkbM domain-containing protein n=1 Tax=Notodromas monacha TaxID=399045 RepID=A0A7R9BYK7_9CRUS|nr:unnamed protein product [Notodromas monacha]CAG0924137.1 unnamed protein product [Notodromas monacha]